MASTRVQLRSRDAALRRGAQSVGWKVALAFAEIEAVIGERPVLGHLTSETVRESGAEISIGALRAARVETELVIDLASAIDASTDHDAIERAVSGFAVGLEIVDVARPPDDLEAIIAANVAHRACVLGPTRDAGMPSGAQARIWVNGECRESTRLTMSYVDRLSALAQILAALGLRLEAGDRVLAGSLTHVAAGAGDHVVAEIAHLGRVEAHLVE